MNDQTAGEVYRKAEPPNPGADAWESSSPHINSENSSKRLIYLACPWTPKGGGMFRIADYLIQAQAVKTPAGAAELRPLDTRGGKSAFFSLWVLVVAIGKLVRGRMSGELAGVHVNMAERLSLLRKSAVVVVCHALGVPVVLHLHAAQLHHFYRRLPAVLQALTRWVFSLPSTCIVLGSVARSFVMDELRVPAERVEVVFNGVPEPTQERRQQSAGRTQNILFVGNLSERKGVSDLLRALALPEFDRAGVAVHIAGGGDVQRYKTMAHEIGISDFVHFEGWADQCEVARLMAEADVLVLPSYDEGLPLVILEALANGVAVVCSPVGEIPSVLTDGLNALLVAPGDVPELATALIRVLRQPELRNALEQNGRQLYEKHFCLAHFFSSVAQIHQRHFNISGQARANAPTPPGGAN